MTGNPLTSQIIYVCTERAETTSYFTSFFHTSSNANSNTSLCIPKSFPMGWANPSQVVVFVDGEVWQGGTHSESLGKGFGMEKSPLGSRRSSGGTL
ncbi:hypothetical protein AVEN_167846-1 [Araneus ventricosus]|uniref:Uncharacterized protein n=1 Tax=Araneus ventricosus TaxID=182803 RepID=A0A4Y2KQ93_ARAVE|nr:hypothetical protein AVEN_167846-1 [Araneus ventricosus]